MSKTGKDYDTLLAACSDESAYKTEEGVHVESVCDDLDLTRITDALNCVPLHTRIGIPKEALLPEKIAEFERHAAARLRAFDEKVKKIATSEVTRNPAREDLNAVLNALSRKDGDAVDDEDLSDEEVVDPNDIVDWLDKVLAK